MTVWRSAPSSAPAGARTRRCSELVPGGPMQSATTAAAPSLHLPVRQEWLDGRREDIIEPDLPIVDPHHHLVDRPETGCYLLPELIADLGSGHNITATVYLEWLSMYRATGPAELRPVGEVEFANGDRKSTRLNSSHRCI